MRTNDRQQGQAMLISVFFLAVLVGIAAAVLDVGAWFHADRKLQATVDAATLAGAQNLPDNPGAARAAALAYANKNGAGITAGDIKISTTYVANDTITIDGTRSVDGFLTGKYGIFNVNVHAHAKARTGTTGSAKYVAPIVVNWKHPMLQCTPPPCSGATQIDLMGLHKPGSGTAAGAFGLINLNKKAKNGNAGANEVAQWMEKGYQDYMDLGQYFQVPSTEFNNVQFKDALQLRLNTEVLFPIYNTISGSGSTAQYEIIGWVGFIPTKFTASGSSGTVYGSFTRVIWAGLPATGGNPAFGSYSVQLVE